MNICEQSHIARLESDNEDLRALCAALRQEIALLQAERVVAVPILGTLEASRRIPQP